MESCFINHITASVFMLPIFQEGDRLPWPLRASLSPSPDYPTLPTDTSVHLPLSSLEPYPRDGVAIHTRASRWVPWLDLPAARGFSDILQWTSALDQALLICWAQPIGGGGGVWFKWRDSVAFPHKFFLTFFSHRKPKSKSRYCSNCHEPAENHNWNELYCLSVKWNIQT